MGENINRERFFRVAEKRTNNILKNLKLLGNCSNNQNYVYESEDVRRIFQAIDSEVRRIKLLFDKAETGNHQFSLKV